MSGWRDPLLIVLLANSITLVTALCFSAVATNSRVGVGGAYFIVSRSLGLEIGGAIGIPLFLSQALSVTLYAYGLAESLRFVWPGVPVQAAAFVIILLVSLLAFRGAMAALRLQVPIMVLIALSLAALAAGGLINASPGRLTASAPSGEYGFWFVFAVFFPAVTGIMAGLSLSGDLTDPKRSIPRGTILATLTGLGVYLMVPILLALGSDPADLRSEPLIWTRIACSAPGWSCRGSGVRSFPRQWAQFLAHLVLCRPWLWIVWHHDFSLHPVQAESRRRA